MAKLSKGYKITIWVAAITYTLLHAGLVEMGVYLPILSCAGLAAIVMGVALFAYQTLTRQRRAQGPQAQDPGPPPPRAPIPPAQDPS